MNDRFRRAGTGEINAIFALYERRVRWMDQQGIRQWNVTGYLTEYPKSYYREQQALGNLYVLAGPSGLAGAVVLLPQDERWPDKAGEPAFYVHNLVADVEAGGAGKQLLAEIEKTAVRCRKRFVRLDCAVDNPFLNAYYESRGYAAAGRRLESAGMSAILGPAAKNAFERRTRTALRQLHGKHHHIH